MNPLTLDFIRRWKWLLLTHFVMVTAAWVFHASGVQTRLHLEVVVPAMMAWDLARGIVRVQLGLPQRKSGIAAALWVSVVGLGIGVQVAAMLVGGAVLAPLLGQAVNPGVLGMHMVFSVVMVGAMQFTLSGLTSMAPERTMAQEVKGGIFGMLWSLPTCGVFWITFHAPANWAQVSPLQTWVLATLGVLTVASWFTTRGMVSERAMPKTQAMPLRTSGNSYAVSRGVTGWRLWVVQEARWQVAVVPVIVVAAAFMSEISQVVVDGILDARATGAIQYRSIGILCVMTIFPGGALAAGTVRAFRGFPVRLSRLALLTALRPFCGGLAVFAVFTLTTWLLDRSAGGERQALLAFLPFCGVLSVAQAVILRYQRTPVMIVLIFSLSIFFSNFLELLRWAQTGVWMAAVGMGLLVFSWWLHVRWLRRGSRICRLNPGFLQIAGGAQR